MCSRVVILAYNEQSRRVGETHHNARLSDALVDRIRELHEDHGRSIPGIARDLGISLGTVKKIAFYQRRAQTPARYKRVHLLA